MKELTQRKAKQWAASIWIVAVLLVVLTFSPLILNPGRSGPRLFSLPYTLWTSMATTILLVVLAYGSSRIRDKLQ